MINRLKSALGVLVRDNKAITAMEYGILAAAVLAAVLAAASALAPQIGTLFTGFESSL